MGILSLQDKRAVKSAKQPRPQLGRATRTAGLDLAAAKQIVLLAARTLGAAQAANQQHRYARRHHQRQ